jgi:leucine dehydrogenase
MTLQKMRERGHEQVMYVQDESAGLRAIIAIHSTLLGPALGGIRMRPYATEDEALADVLELSRGMTFKAAAAGLDLGGGKAVIIGDPRTDKSEALFRAFGRFVDRLNGLFYTGEDVGVDMHDIETVAMETRYVGGRSRRSGGGGDPSPVTSYGVFQGMRACADERWGSPSLRGRRIALQGLGKVGWSLAERLQRAGATVIACDPDTARAQAARERLRITTVAPDEIFDVPADIFSPCALGGSLSPSTVSRLQVEVIAGSANNQLSSTSVGDEVFRRGILYAPDYVINAGGLVNVYVEINGYDEHRARQLTRAISHRLRTLFAASRQFGIPTNVAADRFVNDRLAAAAVNRRRAALHIASRSRVADRPRSALHTHEPRPQTGSRNTHIGPPVMSQ